MYHINYFKDNPLNKIMKLQKKEVHRHKPGRPPEQGNLKDISRWAKVIYTSEELFEVRFGGNERYKFRKDDASVYIQPCCNAPVRCIYHGNKYQTFPFRVYTKFNERIYEEKPTLERRVKQPITSSSQSSFSNQK
jgi:hypothetical protein